MRGKLWFWLWVTFWLCLPAACSPTLPAATNQPTAVNKAETEALLLSTTVRLRWETWLVNENNQGYTILDADGHGTVVNGRYLITHNHHTIPLSLSESGFDPDIYTRLLVFNSGGNLVNILPLTDFQIALREPQMLLLVYVSQKEAQPFGTDGLAVAQLRAWTTLPLEPGSEVAQINWDGSRTTVKWAEITAVHDQQNPPCLEMANHIRPGASGGAIFWQGYHIANSWLNGTKTNSAGGQTCPYSKAALNSGDLIAYLAAHALH
jgi:hypothetical protein